MWPYTHTHIVCLSHSDKTMIIKGYKIGPRRNGEREHRNLKAEIYLYEHKCVCACTNTHHLLKAAFEITVKIKDSKCFYQYIET